MMCGDLIYPNPTNVAIFLYIYMIFNPILAYFILNVNGTIKNVLGAMVIEHFCGSGTISILSYMLLMMFESWLS